MSDKARLPCDVLVQPATLIQRGCRIETLLECIDMRRERSEKGPPLPDIISKRQEATITALRAEVARMREALERIVDAPMIDHANPERGAQAIARAALTQTKDTTDTPLSSITGDE